jgi:predicted TIM-barrel fold metal-dependent hydrolase
MKVDIFSHMIPAKYQEALVKKAKAGTAHLEGWVRQNPALSDVEIRLRRVDRYPDMLEVLVPALAPLEAFVSAADAPDLAKINNDESAAIVEKYPDRFMAAVALLPLSDIDAAVKEAGRACMGLGLRGILMNTTINGEPMDLPKFRPLFAKMVEYDLPIWIHPASEPSIQTPLAKDLAGTSINKFAIWPAETSLAMLRLVMSGVFKEYPGIKFIVHHCGGLVPFCGDRVKMRDDDLHKFYCDTALVNTPGPLMCGYAYFGADHLVFGTDAAEGRPHHGVTWDEIRNIEEADMPAADKEKIFARNASRLLRTGL